ncbi:hypothetical protein JOB18_030471 [Solea senegalensis]|uniref:Lebercilin domain-containing protein n=1 Tax=Solea senegalensis TaxID=28829 RepID=A0AAV6SJW9_SOLSE|nr:hypothetical protein JOB18_030471 [Solea senegalensis]
MLNKLQHHHTVALQHFEEMESRIAETLARHARHVKVLQIMLRETRTCRDHLAKQLLKTEHKLLNMRDTLQDLQHFSQNCSLLEREELTNILAQATAELEEKDKRIQVLEKNLHLCQAYFNHQLVSEQKKLDEERKFSCYLQEQFNQLTKETKDRTRKLEESNAYLKFLLKESTKRDRQNKMVQTEGLALLPAEAARLLEFHLAGTEMKMKDNLDCVYPEQKKQEDTVNVSKENSTMKAETREQKGCAKKRPDDATGEQEAPEALDAKCPKSAKFKREKIKKINNYYPFNQTIINLYHGRPAHSSADLSPCEDTEAGNHVYVVRLPAGKMHLSGDAQ